MRHVSITAAKAHFPTLLEHVEGGEEIVITRHGKPVARLIPEPKAERSTAEVFQVAWALGGLDLEPPDPTATSAPNLNDKAGRSAPTAS